jgi:hypothetical protein
MNDQRLPRGHIERVDASQHHREAQHMPHLHPAGKREHGQAESLQQRERLRNDHELPPRVAVGSEAAQAAEREDRDLRAEPGGAEQQFRMRQPVDEPRLRHILHPGADERDGLAADKEPEVPVAHGAKGLFQSAAEGFG